MPKRNLAWILIVGVIALLMWQLPQLIAGRDSVIRDFGPLIDARSQIQKRFVEKIDNDRLVRDAVEAAISAMVDDLNDPHAIYLNEAEYQRFQKRTDGLYGGIGAEVWLSPQGLEVLSREPDSPAVRAGLRPGDLITHIDGRPLKGISIVEAVNNLLNGPVDSLVKLRILRPGPDGTDDEPRDMELYRAVIKLNPVHGWARTPDGGWRYLLDPVNRIAYVRLIKFTTDVDERLDEVMTPLFSREIRGLVLDLRENTGGLLESAREVVDRFLDNNELIVRTSGRAADTKQWYASREGTYPHVPLVILVNGTTASAAEIVAGALRDHKRAVVVGERTYGKGSVQEVVELTGKHGAIKLTTAYYYLPNGTCIHRTPEAEKAGTWGVQPNVVVNLTPEQRKDWEEAWREIVREHVESPTTRNENDTQPFTSDAARTDDSNEPVQNSELSPADSIENAAPAGRLDPAVERLLDLDIQLRTAFEEIKRQLRKG